MSPCLLIAAGGTGGHIFPALAVAQLLREKGWRIEWLGSVGGLEERLVPMHNIPLHLLPVSGVRGKSFFQKITAPLQLLRSVWWARKIIRQKRVSVVLGMGGFASGPGGIAARLCGLPLVIHEQNAIAGVTNKVLSKIATKRLAAFPGALEGAEVVGNPVRAALLDIARAATDETPELRLLVMGGSRGAKVFNDTVAPALVLYQQHEKIAVWHQAGQGQLTETENVYRRAGFDVNSDAIRVVEFIDDMRAAYRWADVVLCRAGALTVSEIAAIGVPAIFVPYPHAVDDHQTHNAKFLCDADAAMMMPQSIFNAESLHEQLLVMQRDRGRLQQMARNARKVAVTDSAQRVAMICQQVQA